MKVSLVHQTRHNMTFKPFTYAGFFTLVDGNFPVLGWHVKDFIDEKVARQ